MSAQELHAAIVALHAEAKRLEAAADDLRWGSGISAHEADVFTRVETLMDVVSTCAWQAACTLQYGMLKGRA